MEDKNVAAILQVGEAARMLDAVMFGIGDIREDVISLTSEKNESVIHIDGLLSVVEVVKDKLQTAQGLIVEAMPINRVA